MVRMVTQPCSHTVVDATAVALPSSPHTSVVDALEAFASLDSVDLKSIFNDRAHVMRSIPFIMKGAFRCALRTALEEVTSGVEETQ